MTPQLLFSGLVFAAVAAAAVFSAVGAELHEPTDLDGSGIVCTDVAGELVPADPAALARGAGMDPNAYALARVIASEAGNLPWIGQIAVAWVVVNHARAVGRSVLAVVTRATLQHGQADGAGDGFFGRQGDSAGGYRYVSSSKDTTEDHRATAIAVLAGDIDDPTQGAVNFDSPSSYGVQPGTDDDGADTFAQNRQAEGKSAFSLPGVPESRLRLWRRA